MKETQLVKACLDILAAKRIPCWRVNSGAVAGEYKGKKRFVRFNGAKGHSDIAGVLPGGRALFVECKVGRNVLTPDQLAFLDRMAAAGALTLAVWTPDDLIASLRIERL